MQKRTRPKSEKSSCSIYQWCCSRWCKNLWLCHRCNTLPCVWWKDKFPRFSVLWNCGASKKRSTTIRWSMSFSWCRGFFPPSKKQKKAWLSPPERLVKSQIACVVEIVLCELQLERKPRSMSAHFHYFLFSLKFFEHLFPFPLFHFILKSFLMVYYSLLKMFFPWSLQSDKNKVLFFLEGSLFLFFFFFIFSN